MSAAQNPQELPAPRESRKQHQSSTLQQYTASPKDHNGPGSKKDSHNPLTALLSAVVDLPRQYAAVKNVLGELKGRLSVEEWQQIAGHEATLNHPRSGNWIIMDGGVGAGLWYDS